LNFFKGSAIANGIVYAKIVPPEDIVITKRKIENLESWAKTGFTITTDTKKVSEPFLCSDLL
jgi:hypothetical protein